MKLAKLILSDLTAKWAELQPLELPPPSAIVLWQDGTRTIYIEEALGPAVPYRAIIRTDSESNFGYKCLKGQPASLVSSIPELTDWPEYAELILQINHANTEIESVGCAIGYFPVSDHPNITTQVGSYVDIVFSEVSKAEDPAAYLAMAANIMASLAECEKWWASAEIALQRLRKLPGTSRPIGMMLRLMSSGRSQQEARQLFRESLERVGKAIAGACGCTAA